MSAARYIGVDPGPVPGIVELIVRDGAIEAAHVVQCSAAVSSTVLTSLLIAQPPTLPTWVQVEQFVVVRGSQRAGAAGRITRDVSGDLTNVAEDYLESRLCDGAVPVRSAAHVKPWATDRRLEAAGLNLVTKGMRHARDAARHALYVAVHSDGLPDPLSKEWKR